MKKSAIALVAVLLLTLAGGARPARATFAGLRGVYDYVKITNTTPWCVRFSVFTGVLPNFPSTFVTSWTMKYYWDTKPNQSVTLPNPTSHEDLGDAAAIKVQMDLWSQGTCTGGFVGSRTISEVASATSDGRLLQYAAQVQLDFAGSISHPIFNFYFGADKVLQ